MYSNFSSRWVVVRGVLLYSISVQIGLWTLRGIDCHLRKPFICDRIFTRTQMCQCQYFICFEFYMAGTFGNSPVVFLEISSIIQAMVWLELQLEDIGVRVLDSESTQEDSCVPSMRGHLLCCSSLRECEIIGPQGVAYQTGLAIPSISCNLETYQTRLAFPSIRWVFLSIRCVFKNRSILNLCH